MRRETMAGLLFWKRKCFEIKFEGAKRGFLSERKGTVIPLWGKGVCEWGGGGGGAMTEKAEEPKLESQIQGIWRLVVQSFLFVFHHLQYVSLTYTATSLKTDPLPPPPKKKGVKCDKRLHFTIVCLYSISILQSTVASVDGGLGSPH